MTVNSADFGVSDPQWIRDQGKLVILPEAVMKSDPVGLVSPLRPLIIPAKLGLVGERTG